MEKGLSRFKNLDDQKGEDYPYQTEFSYQMNHLPRKVWFAYNIAGGVLLGTVMALLLFVMTDRWLSDPARLVIAIILGIWPTKTIEKMAERTTKVAILSLSATFLIGIILYSIKLLLRQ